MKNNDAEHSKIERAKYLVILAWAVLDLIAHERDKRYLELYRQAVLKITSLLDTVGEKDRTLDPDLGLSLLEYANMKSYNNAEAEDVNAEAKYFGRDVARILDELEDEYDMHPPIHPARENKKGNQSDLS
jgi:hypothetical protein